MDSPNRINPLALTHTVERQTPKNEFGQVLSQTVGTGVRATVGILSAAVRGDVGAVAVKGLETLGAGSPPGAQAAGPVTSGTTSVGSTSGSGEVAGAGGGWDLLQAQRAMQENSQSFQLQYLKLQEDMQRESREYNTLSNVMKARHDSAKAAINNIR